MLSTDTQSIFWDNSGDPGVNRQVISLGTKLRLYSFLISESHLASSSDETIIVMRSGGSGGEEIFGFGLGLNTSDSPGFFGNSVITLPEQGILFEDGLYVDISSGDGYNFLTVFFQQG